MVAGRGEREQVNSRPSLPKASPVGRGDIVADNLDRVAATTEQVLEILNHDAGLMVELKRWIAEDAGESGQVLEESDLTSAAVVKRLNEDLRTRVIATRLLRRYGYLVPKLNPDSEQAQERKLALQERAQELARAAERSPRLRDQTTELAADCDSRLSDCEVRERSARRIRTRSPSVDREGVPHDESMQDINGSTAPRQPETSSPPLQLRIENARQSSLGTTIPTSSAIFSNGVSLLPDRSAAPASDASSSMAPFANDALGPIESSVLPEDNYDWMKSRTKDFAGLYAKRSNDASPNDLEPVRMVRRPNPYADVPSLYDLYVQASATETSTQRFGLEVFRHGNAYPDALPMDLPVGPEYVLGPGDRVSIDIWGGVSQRLFQTVDREGKVVLPEAGPLLVSGKSLGDAQTAVQRALRTQFRDVSADVSLLKLRTVRVYVVGEVNAPGAYDVSSLSTPLNALFAAGGVTGGGSLRRLQHYRGNQLLEEVDAYDLLLHGVRGNMERLENGDSLRVPPLGTSVTVHGMIRRPAVYELRNEANLSDVLDLAGGLLPAATLRHIEVQRLEAHEKRTMLSLEVGEGTDKDALRTALEKFRIQDGDEIHIFPIAPFNSQAVYLEGHVLRPGRYAYHEGMKLTDLVASRSDLLPEPSERYGEIIRIQPPDNHPVIESFQLTAAFEHPEKAPNLQPLDTVRIFGRYDFEAPPDFSVFGEVHNPGRYRSSGQAHLRDAIYLAGGLTPEAWEDAGQLFRAMSDGSTKVFSISFRNAMAGDPLNNIAIEPRDRIVVHRLPERVNPSSVYVRGEVARPGRYPLTANMKVSDLVRSAGGLLRSANSTSGDLTHYAATAASSVTRPAESQGVNLDGALSGEEAFDLPLRDGDVLTVPQRTGWKNLGASVTIGGEVAKPGAYGIHPGERLSSLLRRAGGLLATAYPQAAVFERDDVRALQQKSREELIRRLEQESTTVKTSVVASGSEEAALQQAAAQQRQRILEALRRAPVSSRLVVHIREGQKNLAGSPDDIELRAGDVLEIPKQPGFVVIVGQVYNSNAIAYSPGKNAGWYLSRAGGTTSFANKKAIFIVRANGSVTSGNGNLWSGGVLTSAIGPGDSIVVPEKAVIGGSGWKNVVAIAQVAQAAALAAAVAIP